MKLNDPTLLQQLAYIDGQWVPADSGATLPVTNPATGALLGSVPNMTLERRQTLRGYALARRSSAETFCLAYALQGLTAGDSGSKSRRWPLSSSPS